MKRFAVASVLAALSSAASAEDIASYPSKPIRVITATSAGGTSDIFMRVLNDDFQKRTGQSFIIENRPGGGMNIGGRACAEAPNDGYTICILPNETLAYNQFLFKTIPFDPEKDFAPITNPFFNVQVLVAAAGLNVKTLADLAVRSKEKPGTLSYTAPSIPLQVFMENWKSKSGADLVGVPFKGGGEAVNGVMTGATPVAFFGLSNWLTHIRAGSVVPLAVDSRARSPLLPEVPTLAELGFTGNLTRVYFGIVAPGGTPAPILAKLRDVMAAAGADPEFRHKRLIDVGLEPVFDTPAEFAAFLKEDRAISARVVQDSGFQPR